MHQTIFRPIYMFNNYAYFLDFCAQKFPLIFLMDGWMFELFIDAQPQ